MTAAERQSHFTVPSKRVGEKRVGQPENRPLKIALLGYRSHPYVGGQGIYLKYLSRALKASGHEVHVYSGPPYPEIDANIPLFKVPSLDLYATEKPFRALRPKHLLSYTDMYEWWSKISGTFAEPYTFGRRVQKRLKDENYDIVHDNQSLSSGLVDLQRQGKNIVATIHHPIHQDRKLAIDSVKSAGMKRLKKRWYNFLDMQEKVVNELNHIVTVSETSRRDISQHFKTPLDEITVIENGIDTNVFKPDDTITPEPFRIITTSSSDQPLKGLTYLLSAVAILKREFPKIHLEVIGKLQAGGQTDKQLKKLNLKPYVTFTSGISTEALVKKYAQASIVVCPSLYEGFGLPVAEAMACGRPVVSSDAGALKEVVQDAGILVPPADCNALAEQIRRLFTNEDLCQYLSSRGRKRILKHFCWDKVALKLTNYYYDVLKDSSAEHANN